MKLVLLPGLDGTGVLFRPLLRSLPTWLEPIVVAYPMQHPKSYDDLVAAHTRTLPAEPFLLLGESFGGPLAVRLAAQNPVGLKGLILCGSFVTCPVSPAPAWLDWTVQPILFRTFPWYLKLQSLLGMYESEEHAALGREAILPVAPAVFAHRVREIVRVDVSKELAACQTPLLYLRGTRDQVVRAHNLRRIRRIRADISVADIDSGHMILKNRPVAAAQAIAKFARQIDPALPTN